MIITYGGHGILSGPTILNSHAHTLFMPVHRQLSYHQQYVPPYPSAFVIWPSQLTEQW
jgi:hypothetical protein